MTSRVYYHSWITGPQGARFEIFKSNHSTEVINETKKRLRYDQDVVKIYLVKGEPEDYDHKKERLEFYHIEESSMNIVEAIETISNQGATSMSAVEKWTKALDTIMDRCGVVYDKEQDCLVENRDPDYKV